MKKLRRRLAIGAVTATAAISVVTCSHNRCVYGPPEDSGLEDPVENEEGQETSESQEIPEEEWSAEYNQNEDVYGPPPEDDFDPAVEEDDDAGPEEDNGSEEDGDSEDDWEPEYNQDQALYGVNWQDDFDRF